MYFERTKRIIVTMIVLSLVFLLLVIIGYRAGGRELIELGIMNDPLPTIVMFVSLSLFIITLLTSLGFWLLVKDLDEEMQSRNK